MPRVFKERDGEKTENFKELREVKI